MAGMSGGSMLRTRRKDANVKPNRRLDRKSSRGMLYENEELRLRTININAEVERGQTDIKKLKRENEQLRREVGALRGEYDKLERLLHQREHSGEEHSDNEGSSSCCSDCSSECCGDQNDANTAWDTPELMAAPGRGPPGLVMSPGRGFPGLLVVPGQVRGPLSAVPEEPRSPSLHPQSFQMCSCQPTPSELKPSNHGFSTVESPTLAYQTVVTVPLGISPSSFSLPLTTQSNLATVCNSSCSTLTTVVGHHQPQTTVFPKRGLDILINNNNIASFESFEGFTVAPPIGFIVPAPLDCEDFEENAYQIVPNIDVSENARSNVENSYNIQNIDITSIPTSSRCNYSENINPFDFSRAISQTSPNNIESFSSCILPSISDDAKISSSYSGQFENGGNIEDLLSDIGSVSSNADYTKDSIFVCNTRKVIQQSTIVQNTLVDTVTNNGCNCNCKCNNLQGNTAPDVIVIESGEGVPQSYTTVKSIDLNYDYPKPCNDSADAPKEECSQENDAKRSVDVTQTTHTTTEVNSTVMLIERKKLLSKPKAKFPFFGRSQSAPVETISDEPIYATVKKLPKKLRRLNIKNLENEIRYVPPDSLNEDEKPKIEEEPENLLDDNVSIEDFKIVEDNIEAVPKNGVLLQKSILKLDNASESSDKVQEITIPESPAGRKKKRFSLHFKRKGKKVKKVQEDSVEGSKPLEHGEKLVLDIKGDSDKLIDQSSSPDSPDTVRFKDVEPTYTCKKHKKLKHQGDKHEKQQHHNNHLIRRSSLRSHEDLPMGGTPFRKPGSRKGSELLMKKRYSPSRHYFKRDSYQEMTTSHSEHERTNSLSSSGHSVFSLAAQNMSRNTPTTRRDGSIPWCGCWGNSCL